ncbi:hypothetical protein GCK32_006078 [Trichostrongylus colubriformis]|uniref:Uncharacterized protein n=1 Tax=Trichostrongylus colubriformis TaxID=6319 RepID=A0AAN8J066_TRICO
MVDALEFGDIFTEDMGVLIQEANYLNSLATEADPTQRSLNVPPSITWGDIGSRFQRRTMHIYRRMFPRMNNRDTISVDEVHSIAPKKRCRYSISLSSCLTEEIISMLFLVLLVSFVEP